MTCPETFILFIFGKAFNTNLIKEIVMGVGNFSLRHRVQPCSGAHPAFYPVGTGGSFPGSKEAGV